MRIAEPKCRHPVAQGSVLISSHKDLRKAKGRMASVRVCTRQECIDQAAKWVSYEGPGAVWIEGEKQ